MSALKKILALVIVGGAVMVAVLLFIGVKAGNKSVENTEPPKITAGDFSSIPQLNNVPSENLTARLAEQVSEEIIKKSQSESLDVPDAENIIGQYLAEGMANFDYQSLKPEINDEDLKIIDNDNNYLAEEYLKNMSNILAGFSGLPMPEENNEESISDFFKLVIERHNQILPQLYNLPVPKSLADTHKQEIILLEAQKKIYEYVGNFQTDALTATLAWQAKSQLEEEFETLRQFVSKFVEERGLNI